MTIVPYTDYKHRVYALSANPFHHSSVISAVSGNNEVSMWDVETTTRQQMLWASPLPPFSKMTDDVSVIVYVVLLFHTTALFSLNRRTQYAVCVLVQLMRTWLC